MKIAEYYEKLEHQAVKCKLCPHGCILLEGSTGKCGVRQNLNGIFHANSYGNISSYAIDPIEKKPLYHFYPGKKIVSFGSYGCNFKCQFCQNNEISQQIGQGVTTTAQDLVYKALEVEDSIGIAATYNEPGIQFEFLMDIFELNHKNKGKNVMISNGYLEKSPLSELALVVDAFNIDLKAYTQKFYEEICGARLEPVLETIEYLYDRSHLELTFLLIEGLNDEGSAMEAMFKKIGGLGEDIPIHISRYFPSYKMSRHETSYEALIQAQTLGKRYLNNVYIGNIPGHKNETKCKSCGYTLVERYARNVDVYFQDERCPSCGRFHHIPFD